MTKRESRTGLNVHSDIMAAMMAADPMAEQKKPQADKEKKKEEVKKEDEQKKADAVKGPQAPGLSADLQAALAVGAATDKKEKKK